MVHGQKFLFSARFRSAGLLILFSILLQGPLSHANWCERVVKTKDIGQNSPIEALAFIKNEVAKVGNAEIEIPVPLTRPALNSLIEDIGKDIPVSNERLQAALLYLRNEQGSNNRAYSFYQTSLNAYEEVLDLIEGSSKVRPNDAGPSAELANKSLAVLEHAKKDFLLAQDLVRNLSDLSVIILSKFFINQGIHFDSIVHEKRVSPRFKRQVPLFLISTEGEHPLNAFARLLAGFHGEPVRFMVNFEDPAFFDGSVASYSASRGWIAANFGVFASGASPVNQALIHELVHLLIGTLVKLDPEGSYWKAEAFPVAEEFSLPLGNLPYSRKQGMDEMAAFAVNLLRNLYFLREMNANPNAYRLDQFQAVIKELKQIHLHGSSVAKRAQTILVMVRRSLGRGEKFALNEKGTALEIFLEEKSDLRRGKKVKFKFVLSAAADIESQLSKLEALAAESVELFKHVKPALAFGHAADVVQEAYLEALRFSHPINPLNFVDLNK